MRGQISIDLILAFMMIMVISIFLYNNIINFSDSLISGVLADKVYEVANKIENYALLAYSNNNSLAVVLKPIGEENYVIYVANYTINVTHPITIILTPTKDGVMIKGNINYSVNNTIYGFNLSKGNIILIEYSEGYIAKNTSILFR
ncbi:hypothetical protein J422_01915 [Methanocaldococcus villosus KIN24-T80]|uniref:Uncharacterized protein n=1 Tax=Methanocaldococcus villosus KIN24-T80 TaxID=1069083 RepID=N6VRM9_9EURY|nr:hypothetical protein [Methanocaldococcus villosus]ENN96530.1 hypothetical protein J422_01915 [Methanocaldococcus villosus KIN24-T80]